MQQIRDHIRALEDYLAGRGARLDRLPMPEWLVGRQRSDQIQLRSGLTPEEELPALLHELTHWLVHSAAPGSARLQGAERTICEYEAEAVEVVVLSRLGLQRLLPRGSELIEIDPADALLAHSKRRVTYACERICAALGIPAS
jgi:hypothetical protein